MQRTYHMSCPFDSSKRETLCAPRLPGAFPIHHPIPQLLLHEVRLSSPLHRQRPPFITNPVTYPIVLPHVHEYAHTALQEGRHVVTGDAEHILVGGEGCGNVPGDEGEVRWNRGIDTEEGADGGVGQVFGDVSIGQSRFSPKRSKQGMRYPTLSEGSRVRLYFRPRKGP